jgi:glycosyltransferase involved in cell wall biosynthesis
MNPKSEGNRPLVSIFLPTHAGCSRGGILKRSIDSILHQTYQNFEIIVCDDASIDGTRKLVAKYVRKDSRVRNLRFEPQVGLPDRTIARAFKYASGELFGFAFEDTAFRRRHLETLVEALISHPEIALAYGNVVFQTSKGQNRVLGGPFDLKVLAHHNYIGNASVLVRRSAIDQVGSYDPHVILKRVCDWDLWVRIGKRFPVLFIDEEVVDEYGESRPDSIGVTFTCFTDIISKYMRCDRNSLLRPKEIESYNSFCLNPFRSFSSKEQRQIEFLVLEHLVKSLDLNGLRRLAKSRSRVSSQLRVNNPSLMRRHISPQDTSRLITHLIDYYEDKMTMVKLENIQLRGSFNEMEKIIRAKDQIIQAGQEEIEIIQASFMYRNMHSIATRIDMIFPNGTRRGRIRENLVSRLKKARGAASHPKGV